ncbi:hypothetical protein ACP2AV_15180 [Aliiroseovarius sp. PTFE2010]|uniref:hypothetical protein n=1 Tax=Aliiroseovarius sp. PTFE2010 TaxID=3417190 RepID=UPI003CF52ECB
MEAEKRLIENIHETGILTVDPRSFSDGFYLFYLLPESATDVVAVILQRVTRGGDGMTTAQFNLPLSMAERLGVPNTKRRVSSLVMQHSSGVAFFSLVPDAGLIVTVYVDVGFLATQRFFKGRFMASSDSGVMARVGRNCAFERLGNTKAAAFAARPRLGFKFLEDVPVPVRNLMSGGDPDQHTAAPASYLKSRHG